MSTVNENDRRIIRDTAKMQMEFACTPAMEALKEKWRRHNDLQDTEPLVSVELWTFHQDIIPPLLKCEGPEARDIEAALYGLFVNHWLFGDDTVVPDYFPVHRGSWFTPFGIEIKVERASDNSLGHHFVEVLKDLEEDFHKLGKSSFGVAEVNQERIDMLEELFGDILPVRLTGRGLGASPTQAVVHIMSMENMFTGMLDYPDLFHKMMDMLSDDYVSYFKLLEERKALLPTTACEHVAQGTYAFTNELKATPENLTTKDLWGYMDSQETTGVSPEMYHEFIFPYYKKISDLYGLLSYGCCEAVDSIWDKSLSMLNNLRKVSISPWCDEAKMGEVLRDKKVIYHRKPSPNFLGMPGNIDEEAFRIHIRKTLAAAKGCVVEFTQRDVYRIYDTHKKVRRYVELIKREI